MSTGAGVGLIFLAAMVAVMLIVLLKIPGLWLGIAVVIATAVYVSRKQPTTSQAQLQRSLSHALAELCETLQEFERFAYSTDAEALADRTLYRPELLNPDSEVWEIAHYHQARVNAQRFADRIEAQLHGGGLTPGEVEELLAITDERTLSIQKAWWRARAAARTENPPAD